jgi:F420H(2)-dependent quinone reductase
VIADSDLHVMEPPDLWQRYRCSWPSWVPAYQRPPTSGAYRVDVDLTRLHLLRRALAEDRTIDIVTRGAKTGERRRTEIWFTTVGDEVFITGTPAGDGTPGARRRRDWLANLTAHPEFEFVFKESVQATLPAVATVVTDREERTRVFCAPETAYYRESTRSLDRLVDEAPLVRVTFTGDASSLNQSG